MRAVRADYSPLTPEEQQFAEENHRLVYWFLWHNKLDPDDWYDIVIFRYLLSVQNWMRRPELQNYTFSSILKRSLSSAVSNERVKQSRRIQTVSLEETVPGADDITYMDMVTADNLDYINYGDCVADVSKKKCGHKPKQADLFTLKDFLESRKRKLQLTYDTKEEAINRSKALYDYRKKHGLKDKIRICREANIIWVMKIKGGKK